MRNMGGMASLMGKLPGMGQLPDNVKSQMDDKVLNNYQCLHCGYSFSVNR